MEITPTSTLDQNNVTIAQSDAAEISSDFETFLNMLTVQLKNQDPLDPMDSADFSMQLATFSSVEQQVKTNDLLTALTQQSDSLGLAQISGWIGMEALAATSADFTSNPIEVFVAPESSADSAILVIKNNLGQEVERRNIAVDSGPVNWTGVGSDGQSMLPGSYTFHVESYAGENLLSTNQAKVYAPVSEVKTENGELSVALTTGDSFAASSISSLRSPPSDTP